MLGLSQKRRIQTLLQGLLGTVLLLSYWGCGSYYTFRTARDNVWSATSQAVLRGRWALAQSLERNHGEKSRD